METKGVGSWVRNQSHLCWFNELFYFKLWQSAKGTPTLREGGGDGDEGRDERSLCHLRQNHILTTSVCEPERLVRKSSQWGGLRPVTCNLKKLTGN